MTRPACTVYFLIFEINMYHQKWGMHVTPKARADRSVSFLYTESDEGDGAMDCSSPLQRDTLVDVQAV
eukprot:5360001-Pyramimonas_sp.AAC.1